MLFFFKAHPPSSGCLSVSWQLFEKFEASDSLRYDGFWFLETHSYSLNLFTPRRHSVKITFQDSMVSTLCIPLDYRSSSWFFCNIYTYMKLIAKACKAKQERTRTQWKQQRPTSLRFDLFVSKNLLSLFDRAIIRKDFEGSIASQRIRKWIRYDQMAFSAPSIFLLGTRVSKEQEGELYDKGKHRQQGCHPIEDVQDNEYFSMTRLDQATDMCSESKCS